MKKRKSKYQIVTTAHDHRQNTAERAIQTWKAAAFPIYISNLHESDYDYDFFSVQLLYQTLQQIETQVNLVQPLCINNHHFAYKLQRA